MEQWSGKTFEDIESEVWGILIKTFQETMAEILLELDKRIMATRDMGRYEYKEKKEKTWISRVGPVTIRRRYYWDAENEGWVFLLDEALGCTGKGSLSGGMKEMSVVWGTRGPSYRDAQERLKEMYGSQVISHETIRQLVIQTSKRPAKEAEGPKREKPAAVYIEADGFWSKMQKGRRKESKLVVVHEGWEKRQGKEKRDYRLREAMYISTGDLKTGEDIWDRVHERLVERYGALGEVPVVINGDGAEWIRRGAEEFACGMYQMDRFHLKREIRQIKDAGQKQRALGSVNRNDPQALEKVLLEAAYRDPERAEKIMDLRKRILMNPEAVRDYRVRLEEKGIAVTEQMRGMGAAESSVDRYKLRTGKRGRSWSKEGLTAILRLLGWMYEGTLTQRLRQHESAEAILPAGFAGQIAKRIGKGNLAVHPARFPAMERGTQGYAKTFRQLLQVELT